MSRVSKAFAREGYFLSVLRQGEVLVNHSRWAVDTFLLFPRAVWYPTLRCHSLGQSNAFSKLRTNQYSRSGAPEGKTVRSKSK